VSDLAVRPAESRMKIDDRNSVNINPANVARTQAPETDVQQPATQRRGPAEGGQDRVTLSELSARLRELAGDPAAREARIAALAAQFEAGRYEPDAGAVADAIIAEAELSGGGDDGV